LTLRTRDWSYFDARPAIIDSSTETPYGAVYSHYWEHINETHITTRLSVRAITTFVLGGQVSKLGFTPIHLEQLWKI
jgi:hypothetical protein